MLKFDSYHIQSTRTRIVWCLHHQAHVATLTCTNMISIRNHIQGNNYFAGITSAFTNRDGVVRTTAKHLRGTSEKIQMLFKSRTILWRSFSWIKPPSLKGHSQQLHVFHPMQLWQEIQRREKTFSKSKGRETSERCLESDIEISGNYICR